MLNVQASLFVELPIKMGHLPLIPRPPDYAEMFTTPKFVFAGVAGAALSEGAVTDGFGFSSIFCK